MASWPISRLVLLNKPADQVAQAGSFPRPPNDVTKQTCGSHIPAPCPTRPLPPSPNSNPFHLFLFLVGQEDMADVKDIVRSCSSSYLAAFILAYTFGLVFGIYAVLRVMAQYKAVTLIRQDPRFLLRNRMMMAVARSIGSNHQVS